MAIQDTLDGFKIIFHAALDPVIPGRKVNVVTEIPQTPYESSYPLIQIYERDMFVNRSDNGYMGLRKGNPDRAHDNIYAVEYALQPVSETDYRATTGLTTQMKILRADIEALAQAYCSHANVKMIFLDPVTGLPQEPRVADSGNRFEFHFGDRGPFIISLGKPCIGCRGIISVKERSRSWGP